MLPWIAMSLSLAGVFLNARKIIWCWPIWCLANTGWCIDAWMRSDWPQVILWIVFTIFNCYGWWCWSGSSVVKS
jgi:nicotinamide riboside transporter PnuC